MEIVVVCDGRGDMGEMVDPLWVVRGVKTD